jgi:UDP:flavonoid glycosyltransferase YjiC (YdhE family)
LDNLEKAKISTALVEALVNSGYPFVWNIRPDLPKGHAAVLPPEFASAVEGRALLTTWCPQEAVLQHEAIGVFLTHSGWNSTLESLCAWVPLWCVVANYSFF